MTIPGQNSIRGLPVLLALLVLGCTMPPAVRREPRAEASDTTAPAEREWRLEARSREVGRSVEGRPILVQELGHGPDVVLIVATIHGSEWAGTPLVRRLSGYLEENPRFLLGRRVLMMPVANPDGMERDRRHNARGVDLNRNFPAGNFRARAVHGSEPLSEPESRALHDLILEESPARIVSIHQPVGCIDYDGPAKDLAEAMGRVSDLPVKRIGSLPGSLGSFAGLTLGIPIITLELPRGVEALDDATLWERYGRVLLAAVLHPEAPPIPAG